MKHCGGLTLELLAGAERRALHVSLGQGDGGGDDGGVRVDHQERMEQAELAQHADLLTVDPAKERELLLGSRDGLLGWSRRGTLPHAPPGSSAREPQLLGQADGVARRLQQGRMRRETFIDVQEIAVELT